MSDEPLMFEKFTIYCNKCGGTNIEKVDSRGYSPESGSWGKLEYVCVDCNNRETVDKNW
jgi:hypothetical protein